MRRSASLPAVIGAAVLVALCSSLAVRAQDGDGEPGADVWRGKGTTDPVKLPRGHAPRDELDEPDVPVPLADLEAPRIPRKAQIEDMVRHAKVSPDVVPDGDVWRVSGFVGISFANGMSADELGLRMDAGLTPAATQERPISLTATGLGSGKLYTFVMTDPDAPSAVAPSSREFIHWVVQNVPGGRYADAAMTGNDAIEYLGPAPPYNSGSHRYVFLVYEQPGRVDPTLATAAFESRAGKRSHEWCVDQGYLGPVAEGHFWAAWDATVDGAHEARGVVPPEHLLSPKQQWAKDPVKAEQLFGSHVVDALVFARGAEIVPDIVDAADAKAFLKHKLDVRYASGLSAAPLLLPEAWSPVGTRDAPVSVTLHVDSDSDGGHDGAAAAAAVLKPGTPYALVMTDPDAPSRADPQFREFVHWIRHNIYLPFDANANGGTGNDADDEGKPKESQEAGDDGDDAADDTSPAAAGTAAAAFNFAIEGEEALPYLGPGPPHASGMHRYVFLLYEQAGSIDTSVVAQHFEGRGGKSTHAFLMDHFCEGPIAMGVFEAGWEKYVDYAHAQMEFLPPEEFMSPAQKEFHQGESGLDVPGSEYGYDDEGAESGDADDVEL